MYKMHKMIDRIRICFYKMRKNKHIMCEEKLVQNNLCANEKTLVQNNLCANETNEIRTEEQQMNEKLMQTLLYAEEIRNDTQQS